MEIKMENRKENKLQLVLSKFFNIIWYGWLGVTTLVLIAIISFALIVFGEYDVKIPTLRFGVSDYQYKINGECLQILRTNEITDRFIGEKMAWDFFNGKHFSKYYESLYPKYEGATKLFNNDGSVLLYKQNKNISFMQRDIYLEDNFITLKENSQLLMIILLLPLSFILFGTLILNNCKKIFYSFPDIFNNLNADRLKYIAIFVLVAETLKNLVYYWINFMLSRKEYFMIDSERIVKFFEYSWIDINYSLIFIATIILLFSFVFKVGVQLKSENDLMI
jgi:hypothetical protein